MFPVCSAIYFNCASSTLIYNLQILFFTGMYSIVSNTFATIDHMLNIISYLPIWTIYYMLLSKYLSNKFIYSTISKLDLACVSINMLMIDFLYNNYYNLFKTSINYIDIFQIPFIIIGQDIYFYCSHKIAHLYFFKSIHYIHHSKFDSFYAFYCHPLEQIFINIGSFVAPLLLLNYIWPVSTIMLNIMVLAEIYGAVSSHSFNTNHPHREHHNNYSKNLGTIYLIDNIVQNITAHITQNIQYITQDMLNHKR